MKPTPEKTLGDVIQDALKRAAAAQEKEPACTCMHCSGNIVSTTTHKTKNMEISMAQGTGADGEDEMELTLTVFPADDTTVIRIVGDEAVAEFEEIMRDFFV